MSARDAKGGDFWSRRRAKVAAETEAEGRAKAAAAAAEAEAKQAERSDEEILAELDLPAPEAMERPDQVQALLRTAAPQRLKTRALRRLWRLNPVLANVDGLVDYGEDFTDAATVVENLQTAYQVGKGMLRHVEAQTEAEAAPDPSPQAEPAQAEPAQPETAQPETAQPETAHAAVPDDAADQSARDDDAAANPDPARTDATDAARPATLRPSVPEQHVEDPDLIQIKSTRPRMSFRFDSDERGGEAP